MDINLSGIPEYMHGGIMRYINRGIPPGDFLQAVFSNDFMEMCRRADDNNSMSLFAYGRMLYSAPIGCHGSRDKVGDWINQRGLEGLNNG